MNLTDYLPGISTTLSAKIAEYGPLKLTLSSDIKHEEIGTLLSLIAKHHGNLNRKSNSLQCWMGDLLAYGKQQKFRGQISLYAKAAGLNRSALSSAKTVCLRIPPHKRRDSLPWSLHVEIGKAFSTGTDIDAWLDKADSKNWSRSQLRSAIRESKAVLKLKPDSSIRELFKEAKSRAREFETASATHKFLNGLSADQRNEMEKRFPGITSFSQLKPAR